ncbi:MAG: hypothetical protein JOZ51_20335, partial [Chloroflexi bacterium]|nr:hypothetical protein [Chloroflexota bacterium]
GSVTGSAMVTDSAKDWVTVMGSATAMGRPDQDSRRTRSAKEQDSRWTTGSATATHSAPANHWVMGSASRWATGSANRWATGSATAHHSALVMGRTHRAGRLSVGL